jgi:hypothetical protein
MIRSIIEIKNGDKHTFEEAWTSTEIKAIPEKLSKKDLGNGDTEITMTLELNNISE